MRKNLKGLMVGLLFLSLFPLLTNASELRRLSPQDFQYLGAFRLPGGETPPATFAYGGEAMTFFPQGDPSGGKDGFPGSLCIVGHPRLPYGELPNGSQIAEVSIPRPRRSRTPQGLSKARFLQGFSRCSPGPL